MYGSGFRPEVSDEVSDMRFQKSQVWGWTPHLQQARQEMGLKK